MTVNYRNSAGTDLDSLFAVTNANAGAIGFRESSGQDLGNRYPPGSLGYGVGYKNSAGTDIGYLRGKSLVATVGLTIGQGKYSRKSYAYGYYPNALNGTVGSIANNSVFGGTITYLYQSSSGTTVIVFQSVQTPMEGKSITVKDLTTGKSFSSTLTATGSANEYRVRVDSTPLNFSSYVGQTHNISIEIPL